MTTDLNKVLEKGTKERLIDLYNIINNEPINGAEGKKLKELFEPEFRAMQTANQHLVDKRISYDPVSEEGQNMLVDLCLQILNPTIIVE